MAKKICEECGSEYIAYGERVKTAKYCSHKCANINKKKIIPWNKGKKYSEETRAKISKSMYEQYEDGTRDRFEITKKANETLRNKTRRNFEQGTLNRTISKRGYYMIYLPIVGWKKEHHYIWEKYNGVKVPRGFHLHHINKNQLDNDIKNLRLMSASEHQKLHDKTRERNEQGQFTK